MGHVLEDRKLRYEKPGQRLYLPATEHSEAEVSAWPFPETVRTFLAIKASEAYYENRSTVESVDLLMNYDVGPFVKRIYNTPTLMIVAEGDDLTLGLASTRSGWRLSLRVARRGRRICPFWINQCDAVRSSLLASQQR